MTERPDNFNYDEAPLEWFSRQVPIIREDMERKASDYRKLENEAEENYRSERQEALAEAKRLNENFDVASAFFLNQMQAVNLTGAKKLTARSINLTKIEKFKGKKIHGPTRAKYSGKDIYIDVSTWKVYGYELWRSRLTKYIHTPDDITVEVNATEHYWLLAGGEIVRTEDANDHFQWALKNAIGEIEYQDESEKAKQAGKLLFGRTGFNIGHYNTETYAVAMQAMANYIAAAGIEL